MKLRTKWCSRVLISNLTIAFVNFIFKITFGTNLAPNLQTTLFKMKLSTKGISRGELISNSTIVILNLVPKIQSPLALVKLSKKGYYFSLHITYILYDLYYLIFLFIIPQFRPRDSK